MTDYLVSVTYEHDGYKHGYDDLTHRVNLEVFERSKLPGDLLSIGTTSWFEKQTREGDFEVAVERARRIISQWRAKDREPMGFVLDSEGKIINA